MQSLPTQFPAIKLYSVNNPPAQLTVVPSNRSTALKNAPAALSGFIQRGFEGMVSIEGRDYLLAATTSEKALARACQSASKHYRRIAVVSSKGMDLQLLAAELVEAFTPKKMYSAKPDKFSMPELYVVATNNPKNKKAVEHGRALGIARIVARTLVDMPSNMATPQRIPLMLGLLLQSLRSEYPALNSLALSTLEQVSGDEASDVSLTLEQMGLFTAVAKGSDKPPVFLCLAYNVEMDESHTADLHLVGKGITFDSGGISIKPSNNLHHMKGDMGGAASVIAAMLYAGMTQSRAKLRAFMPLCENMPGPTALKPGDVITAFNGKTVEVIDTDAEGRLVLGDALAYASTFDSKATIDLATLTGACRGALAGVHYGMFSEHPELLEQVKAAGAAAQDTGWQLPMGPEYEFMLKSPVADLSNLDRVSGAGSTNGAMFLREFVDANQPWVHLDIANVYAIAGRATGRPVGMLAKLIDSLLA